MNKLVFSASMLLEVRVCQCTSRGGLQALLRGRAMLRDRY